MYRFLLALLILDGLILGVVILLQAGKGGGLAAMGGGGMGGDGVLAGRQATSFLTRTTWIAGTVFLVLSFVLSIMSSRAAQPTSILREGLQPPAAQPAPVLPGLTDDEAVQDPETVPADAGATGGEPANEPGTGGL